MGCAEKGATARGPGTSGAPHPGGPAPCCGGQGLAPPPPREPRGSPPPRPPAAAPRAVRLTRRAASAHVRSFFLFCLSFILLLRGGGGGGGSSTRDLRVGRAGAVTARGWGGGGSGGGRVAAARARTRVRPERAGAPGPAGARPGARAAVGEGRRLHAPALRQSPTVAAAAAAPRWLRNAAAPHNHGVRGHGSGLRFPALLGNRDQSGGPRW